MWLRAEVFVLPWVLDAFLEGRGEVVAWFALSDAASGSLWAVSGEISPPPQPCSAGMGGSFKHLN